MKGDKMDYQNMAEELLEIMSETPQVKDEHRLTDRVRGSSFVLMYLATHGEHSYPRDISDSMKVSTARIAAILRQLEEEGLITRTTDPKDNRQVIVRLTEDGFDSAKRYRQEATDSIKKLLEFLGPEDAKAYIRIRKKISRRYTG